MHEVCPNHDVVVFQPRTLTTTHLGSRRLSLQYNLSLLSHLFSYTVSGSSFLPISYHFPIRSRSLSNTSSFTCSPTPVPARSAAYQCVAPHLPPTSLRRLSLRPALRACVYRCSRAGAPPLLCRPRPANRSLLTPGGFSWSGSLRVSVSLPHPP